MNIRWWVGEYMCSVCSGGWMRGSDGWNDNTARLLYMEYIEYDMLLHHHHHGGAYTVKMSLCINIFIGHFLRGECHYTARRDGAILYRAQRKEETIFGLLFFIFWSRFQMMKKKEQNIWWDENFAVWWCARRVGYLFFYLFRRRGRKEGRKG